MKNLFTFLLATAVGLGQVALPSEAQQWEQGRKSWESVVKHRPETLPAHTKPEVAAQAIDSAEKARLAFLRGQRGLFCAQAANSQRRAKEWALAAADVHAPDPREALTDLDQRIAAIRQELDRLTTSSSQATPSDATLVYVAKLRLQLEELTRLRSHLVESAKQFVADAAKSQSARQGALIVAGSYNQVFLLLRDLVQGSVLEEERWRHHHNLIRQGFSLPPALVPSPAAPAVGSDWRAACAAVLLP